MKTKHCAILISGLFSFICTAAQAASLCEQKEQKIQREIIAAENNDNQYRVDGLNKALSETRENCNDDTLRKEHQDKIAEQKAEIAKRETDLAEAKQKGDAEKIAKREEKLEEAKAELRESEAREY